MSRCVEAPRDLSHILLVWALEREAQIFRGQASYLDSHSELAFEALQKAAAEAAQGDFPLEQRTSVVRRRAPLRFIDALRKAGVKAGRPGGRPALTLVQPTGGDQDRPGADPLESVANDDPEVDPVDRLLRGEAICPRCLFVLLRMRFSQTDVSMFEMYVEGSSWVEIGGMFGISPVTARKRWERLRPALAEFISALTALEPAFVERMLGRRTPRRLRLAG